MALKSDNSSGLISVANADTTILNNTTEGRWVVKQISLHDYNSGGDTVELFLSSDATSAAGERIDRIVLGANETKPGLFVPFNIPAGSYLIAKATTGSRINVEAIYTSRDGSS